MNSHKEFEILPLEEKDRGVASYLMIYSMLNELGDEIKKIELAGLAIKNGLIVRKFYKAVTDGKITGIISLSNARSGFIELEYNDVKKQYNIFKRKKVYKSISDAFSISEVPNDGGYITFPVSPESENTMVASALLKYVISLKKYKKYYTFISINDTFKIEFLKKSGFCEFSYFNKEKKFVENRETAYYILMEYLLK